MLIDTRERSEKTRCEVEKWKWKRKKNKKSNNKKKADWLVCEVKTTRINDSTPAVGRCSFCFALS
jgi:hypothetical protein|tara:strand:- start:237 stop:431 length:195 start_codon:yes stop_codon:yes gene_type:complete